MIIFYLQSKLALHILQLMWTTFSNLHTFTYSHDESWQHESMPCTYLAINNLETRWHFSPAFRRLLMTSSLLSRLCHSLRVRGCRGKQPKAVFWVSQRSYWLPPLKPWKERKGNGLCKEGRKLFSLVLYIQQRTASDRFFHIVKPFQSYVYLLDHRY